MKRDGIRYVAYDEMQRWNDDTSNTTGEDDVERTDMQQLEEEPGRYHDTRWLAEIQEAATTDEMSTAGLLLTPALMATIVTVD